MPMLDAAEWPLRGREDELHAIVDALDRGAGVLLAGPAGVGKTRLAREALVALPRGRSARLVRATESSRPIPLGALAPLLDRPAVGDGDAHLLARAQAALRADRRLVLGVDDAHLLDEVSATLVHQLVAERTAPVVLTVRTGEPAPAAVTALWKDGLLPRLDVAALDVGRTAALLEAALRGQVHSDSTRRLHSATAGNVLWLRQLVAGELRDGRLAQVEGLWTWTGEPRLGPALTELIDTSIGALAGEARAVVELLALGEPLDIDVLAALAGPAGLDEALTRGLVFVSGPDEARLAHPLYGDVVRARVGERRAREVRGRLATALADVAPHDLLRRATLAVDSDLEPDPKLLTAAAERAIGLNDIYLAIRLLEAACAGGAGFEAQVTLAYTLSYILRADEAERAFVAAAELARIDAQVSRVAQLRAINLLLVMGRGADAMRVAEAAERATSSEVGLLGFRATAHALGNRLDAAERCSRRLLSSAEPPAYSAALVGWVMTVVSALVGRADGLAAVAADGKAAALASPETATFQTNIAFCEVFGLALAGRPSDIARRTEHLIRDLEGLFLTFMLPVFDGLHALTAGRATLAARKLREYRPYFPGYGGGFVTWFESLGAIACGTAGDAQGARDCVVRAESLRLPDERFLGPLLELGRAWTAAAEGAVSTAAATARGAADLAAGSGQWAVEVLARHAAVGFGDRTQAARLRELAGLVDGPRSELAAAHAEALAAGDADALLAVSTGFEAAGLLLGAAESAAHAADLLRRGGRTAHAIDAAARATGIAAECGARTPALAAATRPSPLSARQREIAMLAARLSNAEIAEQLGVSVRTIEGHIYHACVRLGLANRTELAAHVAGAPPASQSTPG